MIRKFGLLVALTLVLGMTATDSAMAQRGGPGGGGFGGGRGGFGGGSSAMMLGNPAIRDALELTDDQIERLDQMQQDMRAEMGNMWQGMRDLSPEERNEKMASMREDMAKAAEKMEKELDSVLLKHQREQLSGMFAKSMTQRGGGIGGLFNNPQIAKQLGLSEKEVEKLKEKAEEMQEKQNEEINKVREKYNDKLIALLPKEAQAKVKAWMETELPEMGGRGGQQGAPQQRGGGRQNRPQDF